MSQSRSRLLVAVLVSAAASTVGCGAPGPDLVNVTGVVTRDGQPVVHAAVLFSPDASNPAAIPGEGVTDSEGRYRLISDQRNGAVPGKYYVVVTRAGGAPPAAALPPEANEAFKDDPFMAALSAGGTGGAPTAKKKGGPAIVAEGDEYTFDIEVAAKGGAIDFDLKPKKSEAAPQAK